MSKPKLTAAFVKSAKGPATYYDQHGLMLVVSKTGSKRWLQRLTLRGRRLELGLGSIDFTSLAKAREIALENRRLCRQGIDPRSLKKLPSKTMSFAEAARKTHAEFAHTWKNPKDRASFLSTMERYIFPKFGQVSIDEVKSVDIRAAVLEIRAHVPSVARKLEQRVRLVFKWAIANGLREDNPALADSLALPKASIKTTHRKHLPYSEVHGCIETVKASKAASSTKWAIEFLIHTAARSSEVREATWVEFDLNRKIPIWTVPAERMKMNREHRVPLTPRAVEIIQAAKSASLGGDIVFEGMESNRPLSDMTLSKLVRELGFDAHVHGFRTSFRTWVQEQTEYPAEVGETALAHVKTSGVEAAYARSDLFEKRYAMMLEWSKFISKEADIGSR